MSTSIEKITMHSNPGNSTLELKNINDIIASVKCTDVLQSILDHLVHHFNAASGCIALLTGNDRCTIQAASGAAQAVTGSQFNTHEGLLGWVIENKTPLLLSGTESDDPRFRHLPTQEHKSLSSPCLLWPLTIDQTVIGAIKLGRSSQQMTFCECEFRSIGDTAGLLSLAANMVLLYESQQRRIWSIFDLNDRLLDQQSKFAKTHQKLMSRETQFGNILEIAPEAIIVMDEAHRIVIFNRGAADVFGYTGAEVIGKSLDVLLPFRFKKRHAQLVESFSKSDDSTRKMDRRSEVKGQRKDGREFPAGANISKTVIDGQMLYTVILRDLSDEKLAEQELLNEKAELANSVVRLKQANVNLENTQNQLLQSEKMACIGQLAAGIAHEINNPVGYVNSNIAYLVENTHQLLRLLTAYEQVEAHISNPQILHSIHSLKKEIDIDYLKQDLLESLSESQEGITRIRDIVQDLKDFSHVDDMGWRYDDIHKGLDSTLNIAHNEIKYKAEVIKHYGELPKIECILSQLNQVFMNILVNAAQAIERHGQITIKTGTLGDSIWIEISDNGPGMDEHTAAKIFDPFFTTKPVGQGTGLGLSISYKIIFKHNGKISVHSEPGLGTTFRIVLPVSQGKHKIEPDKLAQNND